MSQSRTERFRRRRRALVDRLAADGDLSQRALDALLAVERHRFVPHRLHGEAYENHPLPIGMRQTISQPFMVGWLVDAVHASPGRRILEIGTGCGYQAAVLAQELAALLDGLNTAGPASLVVPSAYLEIVVTLR